MSSTRPGFISSACMLILSEEEFETISVILVFFINFMAIGVRSGIKRASPARKFEKGAG
jgi:hypothetical protein